MRMFLSVISSVRCLLPSHLFRYQNWNHLTREPKYHDHWDYIAVMIKSHFVGHSCLLLTDVLSELCAESSDIHRSILEKEGKTALTGMAHCAVVVSDGWISSRRLQVKDLWLSSGNHSEWAGRVRTLLWFVSLTLAVRIETQSLEREKTIS